MRIRIRIYLFILLRIRAWVSLFILTRIRIRLFTLMGIWIRILLLIKVMRICDHWSKDPPRLHFEPPRLRCERPLPSIALPEPLEILNFSFNADLYPDPEFNLMRIRIQIPKLLRIRAICQYPSVNEKLSPNNEQALFFAVYRYKCKVFYFIPWYAFSGSFSLMATTEEQHGCTYY
jgi:hypothetical protein